MIPQCGSRHYESEIPTRRWEKLEPGILDVKVAKKEQIVIPKPLREKFRIREDSHVTLVATEEGVVIRPALQRPWSGLRGLLKGAFTVEELDRLLKEAGRSLRKAK